MPPRAGNVSIDSSRLANALGFDPFDPWPLADEHVRKWVEDKPIRKFIYVPGKLINVVV